MIDLIQHVFWWLVENPTVIAAFIGALPAVLAALWARSAKKETQPNHGKSLRDTIDQMSERQVVLMKNDSEDRKVMNGAIDQLKKLDDDVTELGDQATRDRDQADKDRDTLRSVVESVFSNHEDYEDNHP